MRSLLVLAVAVGAMAPLPAAAQGAFNMGGLTQTLTIPTDQAETRRARDSGAFRSALRPRSNTAVSRADRAIFDFRRDPAITRRVQQRFVARLATPAARAEMAANLGNATQEIVQALRPVGLQYTNLADAQAAYLVTAWQVTHNQTQDIPAQFQAVSRQFTDAGARLGMRSLSNADKQELAETLLYDAVFMGSLLKRAQSDPALKRQITQMALSGTRSFFGIDISRLTITKFGLTPPSR